MALLDFYYYFFLVKLTDIIIIIISLSIHLNYITDFIDKINLDFKNQKHDFKWNVIQLICSLIFLSLGILIFLFIFDKLHDVLITEDFRNKEEKNIFKRKIKEKDDNITKLSEENRKMKQKVKDNKDKLNEQIFKLEEEKEEIINEAQNKFQTLKNDINSKIEEIKKLKKENNDLKKIKENFFSLIDKKEKEINLIKSNLPFELKEGEKLMCVIFQCTDDQEIHCPIICKDKQIFNNLENMLYEKFPKYKETENVFISNSAKINELKTLEENNIKDGQIIMMTVFDSE